MIDWITAIVTASLTALFGIVAVIIDNNFIKPYYKFKEKLRETKVILLFFSNILTNRFVKEEMNDYFFNKIRYSLDDLREKWAELSTFYSSIHLSKYSLANLPKPEKMKEIQTKILNLSNRMDEIVISKNSKQDSTCSERKGILDDIIKFIDKYS